MKQTRKVAIIGMGHVGSHVASMLITRSICDELVLIDSDEEKMRAQTVDLADSLAYQEGHCRVYWGNYSDISDADILVLSVGGKFFDENRLEELDSSMEIIDEIAPEIEKSGFRGIVLSITNPCDLVAYYLQQKISATVIGSGTALDSARFRIRVAQAFHVNVKSVEAFCIGEHGNSQVPVWSQVKIGGKFLKEILQETESEQLAFDKRKIEKSTIFAGWEIAGAKGSTEFGIGIAASELIRAVLSDANLILPCSVLLDGVYGEKNVYASVPCLIGRSGVKKVWEVPIAEEEKKAFHQSCRLLRSYIVRKMDTKLQEEKIEK